MPDAIAAALCNVDALVAAAQERGAGEAADLEAVTVLLRRALAKRSVFQWSRSGDLCFPLCLIVTAHRQAAWLNTHVGCVEDA